MTLSVGRVKVACPRCRGELWTDVFAIPGADVSACGELVLRLSVGPIDHNCEAVPLAPDAILELPPNALLVYQRLGDPELLVSALKELGRTDVLVVDLNGDDVEDTIAVLDEEQMAAHGWIRAADVNRE